MTIEKIDLKLESLKSLNYFSPVVTNLCLQSIENKINELINKINELNYKVDIQAVKICELEKFNYSEQHQEPELLPCPFCGGKASLQYLDENWYVTCPDENSDELHCMIHVYSCHFETKEKAILAWNKRK